MLNWQNEDTIKLNIKKNTKITKIISYIRLILGIALIVSLILLFSTVEYVLYGIISGVLFCIFLFIVIFSNKFYKELELNKQIEKIYFIHNKRRNKEFNALLDNGKDFKDKNDYKLSDLDIFGSKSLYQYLSSAKTKLGREKLANRLKNTECKDIYEEVLELGTNEDSNKIEAKLLEFDNKSKTANYDEINHLVNSKININPVFLIIDFFLYVGLYVYFILALIFNLTQIPTLCILIIAYFYPKVFLNNEVFSLDASSYNKLISSYYDTALLVNLFEFKSKNLLKIKESCSNNITNLKKYKITLTALALRRNIFVNIVGNVFFGYDLITIIVFNNLSKSISSLNEFFDSIGELEVDLSFSNIIKDHEIYTKSNDSNKIVAKGIYHPLVKDCIPNDFTLDGGIVLTGSNMSGKTTFMRTMAVNVLLSNACGLAFAIEFSLPKLKIMTSLRANDMLSEGISTFYAEILRMKAINEAIINEKCFVLVDEIFKGTNAKDRIDASMKVIDKLNKYNVFFIVSTHDPELCDAKGILNYHFNEHYVDDKIQFDYKIKEGKALTSNAIYLLKLSGIIE